MKQKTTIARRSFLKRVAAAAVGAPWIVPASVLGRDGHISPSERILLGGIGIRHRGGYVLSHMLNQPDVQEYFREHFLIFPVDIEGDSELGQQGL